MALFPPAEIKDAIRLSREDVNEPLASFSKYEFHLDDADWPSVEHYFQAMKFENPSYREKIRTANHPKVAHKLGNARFKRKRSDWQTVREIIMTRAVYIKCRTHDAVAKLLLATGDKTILETSAYDYFWGCGRDGRGINTYGKVLMNVRDKLRQESLNEITNNRDSDNEAGD